MNISKFSTHSTITTDGRTISYTDTDYPDLGTLLIILEVRTVTPPLDSETLDNLIDKIISDYYDDFDDYEKRDPEARLEKVASTINKSIRQILHGIDPISIKKNVSLFVGVIHEEELFFSKTGQIQILLKHSNDLIPITDESEETNATSILSYITSGKLTRGDAMLITTDALLDYFSHAKIKKILTEKTPKDASAEFKALVEEFAQQTLFQAIILNNAPKSNESATNSGATDVAQSSISEFNLVEASTGDLLSNSFWLTTKKSIQGLARSLKNYRNESAPKRQTNYEDRTNMAAQIRRRHRSPLSKTKHKIYTFMQKTWIVIVWAGQQIISMIKHALSNRHGIAKMASNASKSLPRRTIDTVSGIKTRYKMLDNRRRNMLLVAVALVFVLILSIGYGRTRTQSSMTREEIIAIFDEIDVKRASAEAAILYGNEPQAVRLISEARRLLNNIEVKEKDFKTRKSELATGLFETYKSLQKLEEIDQPRVIADLGGQPNGGTVEIKGLGGSGDVFYAFDENNTIYEFDTSDASVTPIGNMPETVQNVLIGEDGEIFVYTSGEQARIYELDADNNSAGEVAITFTNPISIKPAIIPYFSRIYTLDPRERQIFKHQLVGSTYTRGTPWIKDTSVDLSMATDMAIDGNVWVVTSNGEIMKLTSGVKEDFAIPSLDPPLNNPTSIWTSVDSGYLYILDPATHRVVILTKDGKIQKQYVSQRWSDLRDMSINEKDGKIFVLSGNSVFEVDMELE